MVIGRNGVQDRRVVGGEKKEEIGEMLLDY